MSPGRAEDEDIEAWQRRIAAVAAPTPVLERFYFRCVYFREPSDALFEIATRGPGVTVDEPLATLGDALSCHPCSSIEGERSRRP